MPFAVQSSGNVVVARKDRQVEIRRGDALSTRVGIVGRFSGDITGLGVLSDDTVVVATSDGKIQVHSSDLSKVIASSGGMADIGDGIESILVDTQDRIVIKTTLGNLRIVTKTLQEVSPSRRLVHP